MAQPTMVSLTRSSPNEPWGFRISGGRDFRMQLQVKKVCIKIVHSMSNTGRAWVFHSGITKTCPCNIRRFFSAVKIENKFLHYKIINIFAQYTDRGTR